MSSFKLLLAAKWRTVALPIWPVAPKINATGFDILAAECRYTRDQLQEISNIRMFDISSCSTCLIFHPLVSNR